MRALSVGVVLAACGYGGLLAASPPRAPVTLDRLKPGHWYEVPNSRLRDVVPRPVPPGVNGPPSIMSEWSGGAYDSRRDRLIVWGGGHSGYAGNEVYVFELATLKWRRLTEPSRATGGDPASGYYPDGLPRARHTYDYVEYVPGIDSFCSFGGAALYPEGGTVVPNVDCLNLATGRWERRADAIAYGIGALSAYDPVEGKVWVQGAGREGLLASYDPRSDRWRAHDEAGRHGWLDYELTAEIDPRLRKFVAVGHGYVYAADLRRGYTSLAPLKTVGASAAVRADSPGLAYSPAHGIVAWAGGAKVYSLDFEALAWSTHAPASDNKAIPPAISGAGVFGRFRYSRTFDVFVLANDVDANVWLYRFPAIRK